MALKWKVENGKKYLWDTFNNSWSYRGDITSAVPEGVYENEIPFPKGTRDYNEQKMSIANLVGGAADAAIKGVTGAGEYVSKGIGKYGKALAESVARPIEGAVKSQFPERKPNTIYAPTASERLVGGIMASMRAPQVVRPEAPADETPAPSVPPVAPAPAVATAPAPATIPEPVLPPAPAPKVVPEMPEGMSAEYYKLALDKGLDPKAFQESLMKENMAAVERSRAREEMYSRNPWMRPGYGQDLIEAKEHAKKLQEAEAKGKLEAKKNIERIGQDAEARVRARNKEEEAAYWAEKNKPKMDLSSFPSSRPKYVEEEQSAPMSTQDYSDEYNRRYRAALAGKYQPYTKSSNEF